jgi:hypothetical protein
MGVSASNSNSNQRYQTLSNDQHTGTHRSHSYHQYYQDPNYSDGSYQSLIQSSSPADEQTSAITTSESERFPIQLSNYLDQNFPHEQLIGCEVFNQLLLHIPPQLYYHFMMNIRSKLKN